MVKSLELSSTLWSSPSIQDSSDRLLIVRLWGQWCMMHPGTSIWGLSPWIPSDPCFKFYTCGPTSSVISGLSSDNTPSMRLPPAQDLISPHIGGIRNQLKMYLFCQAFGGYVQIVIEMFWLCVVVDLFMNFNFSLCIWFERKEAVPHKGLTSHPVTTARIEIAVQWKEDPNLQWHCDFIQTDLRHRKLPYIKSICPSSHLLWLAKAFWGFR